MALWEGTKRSGRGTIGCRSNGMTSPLPKHQRRCLCGGVHRHGVQLDNSAGTGSPSPLHRCISPHLPICPSAHSSHSRPPSSSSPPPVPQIAVSQTKPSAPFFPVTTQPASRRLVNLRLREPTDPARAPDNSSVPPGQPSSRAGSSRCPTRWLLRGGGGGCALFPFGRPPILHPPTKTNKNHHDFHQGPSPVVCIMTPMLRACC